MAYEVEAMIVAVSVGFVLWFVTQWNVVRTGKAIKADIDSKRTGTERFVDERLGKLEAIVAGMEGRLTAQIPPNVHGELVELQAKLEGTEQALQAKVDAIDRGIAAALEKIEEAITGVPRTLEMHELARRSVQERDLRARIDEAGEELQEIAEGELAPYVDQGDPFATEMLKWAKKPVDADYESRSPIGAGLLRVMKGAVAKEAGILRGGKTTSSASKGGSPYGV